MIPVDVLLSELWNVNPSFIIVYNHITRKTCVFENEIEVSSADTIDMAVLRAWNKVFGPLIDERNYNA